MRDGTEFENGKEKEGKVLGGKVYLEYIL